MLDHLNDPHSFELVRFAGFMLTLEHAGNAARVNVVSPMVSILTRFRVSLFSCSRMGVGPPIKRWGQKGLGLPKICDTYPIMIKLG